MQSILSFKYMYMYPGHVVKTKQILNKCRLLVEGNNQCSDGLNNKMKNSCLEVHIKFRNLHDMQIANKKNVENMWRSSNRILQQISENGKICTTKNKLENRMREKVLARIRVFIDSSLLSLMSVSINKNILSKSCIDYAQNGDLGLMGGNLNDHPQFVLNEMKFGG